MKGFLLIIFIVLFVFAFIYFGYYQDYKRNPKEFVRTIIAMPVGFVAEVLGFKLLSEKLKRWANNDQPSQHSKH